MHDIEELLINHGAAGASAVTISIGNDTVTVKAIDLWRALAKSRESKTDREIDMAIMALSRDYSNPAEALTGLARVMAAVAVSSASVNPAKLDMIAAILPEMIKSQIDSCRETVERSGVYDRGK